MKYQKNCLYPECSHEPYARGLCSKHYQSTLNFIKQTGTKWDVLEKAGKVLPKQPTGRHSKFCKWLASK